MGSPARRKLTDHYQKHPHCLDHPSGSTSKVAHSLGGFKSGPSTQVPHRSYLFNTGLFHSRSQNTPHSMVPGGRQVPKKDIRDGGCGGGRYADLMNNNFWLFPIKSVLALSYPGQGVVCDTRSVPGALLKVRFPAMVPALTHNDRVLPEQASLMHRTEDLGDFSVGVQRK